MKKRHPQCPLARRNRDEPAPRQRGVPGAKDSFLTELGLARKPNQIRPRFHDSVGISPFSEMTVRVEELARQQIAARSAVIVENEITFLSVLVPVGGVVLWGKGFEVDRCGALTWLSDLPIHHWGDLDMQGFAITNRLRAWLPQTTTFLMDRATLLEHQRLWTREANPTNSRLDRLDPAETDVYDSLVTDLLGTRVQLEQERVSWEWVLKNLPYDY